MTVSIALAGATMLGRGVAELLGRASPTDLVAPEVAALTSAADLTLLNLECCISERGDPWPERGEPFSCRAPPVAVELLSYLGVDAVTLANDHALDFGHEALCDTLDHLRGVGIRTVGAGRDLQEARSPLVLRIGGLRIGVVAATDHQATYAATEHEPGVAHADLAAGVPEWLHQAIVDVGRRVDLTLATPHWGPDMAARPVPQVLRAADALFDAGVDLIAGHSAHVFHGVRFNDAGWPSAVLYDLGNFLADHAVDEERRNDLGVLWLVEMDADGPVRLEAVPLRLRHCRTERAVGADRDRIARRLITASAAFETRIEDAGGRLVVHRG